MEPLASPFKGPYIQRFSIDPSSFNSQRQLGFQYNYTLEFVCWPTSGVLPPPLHVTVPVSPPSPSRALCRIQLKRTFLSDANVCLASARSTFDHAHDSSVERNKRSA
ncbi:hypothetical protein GALMADRAFT_1112265 [Galerina marginata CBS 339.88]|uniref:Uncharacterized protein n=1 Tax=Galerina marginata (strain CBS 339.88) TaxID=685588 RepID=A0A067TPH2_GALM3|nr:hypothetical protein GALMADRAFT_1112265 [Galerina marginata CBS 339.88]